MDYPRVTEILRAFSGYENVPKQILENKAAKGSTVHALCAGIAKGHWIPDGMIDQDLLGYINSFKQWSAAQVKEFLVIEKRYHEDLLQYSGQVDYVVTGTDGELYLCDIKTSVSPQKTYPVQMAAYSHLLWLHGIQIKGAMLIYLSKEGEFPNIHYLEDMAEEFDVFVSAMECWKYFNKRKSDGRNREDECVSKSARGHVGTVLYTKGFEEGQRSVRLRKPRSSDSSVTSVPSKVSPIDSPDS